MQTGSKPLPETWQPMTGIALRQSVEGSVLEEVTSALTEKHFPLVRVRKRSNEDPWITRSIRRLWKKKVRLYNRAGKCAAWWETDAILQREIDAAKEGFVDRLLEDGGNGRSFYAATKRLATATATPPWKVSDLYVGLEPGQICREVLGFYGALAKTERPGLRPVGPRFPGGLARFSVDSTLKMLKESKKTDSSVPGDPLPHLIRSHPEAFARPVMQIYNRINDTGFWPAQWKIEYLTIIPKIPNPSDLSECRNISCTSAFSKILEYQVLAQLRAELAPDPDQYGGVPKCGVEHLLLDLWEGILTAMEDGKTAAVLLGVDYEKAFNRMEHDVCLHQLEALWASAGSLSLVRSFLEGRRMTIVIDGQQVTPEAIERGSPQGSVLGCLLYCVTTQSLTKGLRERADQRGPLHRQGSGDGPANHHEGDVCGEPSAFLYVDDTTLLDRVPVDSAQRHLSTSTPRAHFEELRLERDFAVLEGRAGDINMRINTKKTQLLVIGPANGYDHTAALLTRHGDTVNSIDRLKLVGFTFGTKPGVGEHVLGIKQGFMR